MALDETQLLIVLLFALVFAAIAWIVRLEFRLHKLLLGTDKKSLGSSIVKLKKSEEAFFAFKKHIEESIKLIEDKLTKSIRYVDTIRFDPFKSGSSGGNQSFATAFLDENKNGVVISTVHTRERVGVFSKPIKGGRSEYELTEEERAVIDKAINNK